MKKTTLFIIALFIIASISAKKIYLDPWQWSSDNAKFSAWAWENDKEGTMYPMNYEENAQLYSVEIPNGINNILFLRKSPDHSLTNWDYWNQTVDLTIPTDKNKFTINNWNESDNKSGGEWSTYTPNEIENPNNPTNIVNGTKLYLKPSEEWKLDKARFAAYFLGGDGELWLDMNDLDNDGIYEVTSQGTREKVIFCRMNPEFTDNRWNQGNEDETGSPKRVWNQTSDLTYDGVNNQYNIIGWENGTWSKFTNNNNDNNDPNKPQIETNIYTLCGDKAVFGSDWDPTDTNNDMIKNETTGLWSKKYYNITLTSGSYEYKIAANHNWDSEGKYPTDNTNMTLYIAKEGIYDITFTFNPLTPELKVFTTNRVNVENITKDNIYTINGFIYSETDITIYTITGQDVTSLNGNLENGIYIVKTKNLVSKLIIK